MKSIKFTAREVQAVVHRLSVPDALRDVFADTEGLEHLADAVYERALSFEHQLRKGRTLIVEETSELDRELMVEIIEGSTWVAIHDPRNDTNNTPQAYSAAYRTLCHIADKVSLAFDILVSDIDIPNY